MSFRDFLTAAVLGMALATGAPALAGAGDLKTTAFPVAGATGDNVHKVDWRGDRWERRAERHAHRRWEHRAERRAHRRWERRAERRAHRRWERRAERRAHRRWEWRRDRLRERRRAERYERRYDRNRYGRGDYLPRHGYRIVDNWYDYGWRRPYRGQRYAQIDGRYFLIQAATGLIIAAILY